ncbi:MAG: hypothetical protein PHU62_07735 [Bacteroidales bacterium]|jgi:hypothetical protein|nr:hypothetical protein [Bacteroidales bacterium]MDD2204925.1 hypothetical protein [Bacteroidales bacterium]MDD3152690.1 hypothetical protein [Bacteroidales bacterium]MDD3914548.1 hypothetical protein [Bacteroidales bacterium]MDD4634442.1 hypothetical protein [Bacteroidales bacterium]
MSAKKTSGVSNKTVKQFTTLWDKHHASDMYAMRSSMADYEFAHSLNKYLKIKLIKLMEFHSNKAVTKHNHSNMTLFEEDGENTFVTHSLYYYDDVNSRIDYLVIQNINEGNIVFGGECKLFDYILAVFYEDDDTYYSYQIMSKVKDVNNVDIAKRLSHDQMRLVDDLLEDIEFKLLADNK